MSYIRFTITEPFHMSVKIPLVAAEWAARIVGASMVLAPAAVFAAVVSVSPSWVMTPLPLPAKAPTKEKLWVDQKELDCLANNIYYEARNQSEIGQLAVGMVTVTRAKDQRWSKTICGVVYDPKQFSWTWDRKQNLKKHEDVIQYLRALNLASRILYGEFDGMKDMFTADHYHTTAVNPAWAKKLERVATIDNHVFLR